ncbi:MAG TPA: amidohydrolase family protein [Vicinamibacterales bacterium]|jgi:dihydroorotase|nr:amidohydrolase family protein [Vicinamibacterales bacterium]
MSVSTRRGFLGTLGAAAVAVPALGSTAFGAGGQAAASYDLLIKGGRVIDPSQKINGPMDVAIAAGKVAAVAANIPANRAKQVFDAGGKLVTPGLINVHAHVYKYVYPISVDPDAVGLPAGVTTIVDAGSAGASTFPGLRKFIMEPAPTRIYAMLNISQVGNFGNELYLSPTFQPINVKAAINTIINNKDKIVAIKVRINGDHAELMHDLEVLKRACMVRDDTGLPIMLHWTTDRELLALLKRGDILTHTFTIPTPRVDNLFGGPTQGDKVLPQILELKERGIFTEGQMVNSHHMFDVSEKAFAQGWIPDLLGTDMGAVGKDMPNGILLPWEMTQYLHLGLSVEQVIERVTLTPTKVFKFPEQVGTLQAGAPADVTVIDLQQGQFQLFDQKGQTRTAKQRFVPVAAVHGGTLTKIDPAVHETKFAGVKV